MDQMEYRQKSSGIIFNDDNEFLLVQLVAYGDDEWNTPGGGIEPGETPRETMIRELQEELGTDLFEILEESPIVNTYDFPTEVLERLRPEGRLHKGQSQTQFIVKFLCKDSDIKVQKKEVKRWKWVKYSDLSEHLRFPNQYDNIVEVIESSNVLGFLI